MKGLWGKLKKSWNAPLFDTGKMVKDIEEEYAHEQALEKHKADILRRILFFEGEAERIGTKYKKMGNKPGVAAKFAEEVEPIYEKLKRLRGILKKVDARLRKESKHEEKSAKALLSEVDGVLESLKKI